MEACPTKIFFANTEAHKRDSGEVLGSRDIYTAFTCLVGRMGPDRRREAKGNLVTASPHPALVSAAVANGTKWRQKLSVFAYCLTGCKKLGTGGRHYLGMV
jgi:hypothetical protein